MSEKLVKMLDGLIITEFQYSNGVIVFKNLDKPKKKAIMEVKQVVITMIVEN